MPYYSGSAANIGQVRDAIVSACTANGWSWSNEVLGKNGVFVRLWIVNEWLRIQGRTSAAGGDAPTYCRIGPLQNEPYGKSPGVPPLTWPVTYHVFVFSTEVYCVIKFGTDAHFWLCFGKSVIAGLPGTGCWYGASACGDVGAQLHNLIDCGYGGVDNRYNLPAFGPCLFFSRYLPDIRGAVGVVHHGFDTSAWSGSSLDGPATSPLMATQPNSWTSEAVLLPIRHYTPQPENKISLTLELEHARHINLANLEPGQIIVLGNDRWMIFPWFRKSVAFSGVTTGPLGWAIRYEGP